MPKLKRAMSSTEKDIRKLTERLEELPVVKKHKKRAGRRFKLDGPQLADMLVDCVGEDKLSRTEKGNIRVDEDVLSKLDHPLARGILEVRSLNKCLNTYLKNLQREQVNGIVRPFYNLNLVITYRSSSDSPNFQNMPIRDPVQGKLIRSVIIPREGHQIGEIDLKGAEVNIAYCYHKDPRMKNYLTDPATDMHRDQAMECFLIRKPEHVSKKTRYVGKNGFVFPAFYGSYWAQIAPNMWNMMDEHHLMLTDRLSVREHLFKKGIEELGYVMENGKPSPGSFMHHISKVEHRFWNERFKVYKKWKEDWYEAYLRKGYFDTLTGFRCSGEMKRNEVVNYPVQGSAFHCLLWVLIQTNRWLKKNKMRSRIIGQVHDSIIVDFYPPEVQEVLAKVRDLLENKIREVWPWIIIRLTADFELAPIDGSWAEKQPV
ncbi:MAG: DNA polymerase [Smithella sp.]